MWPHHSSKTQVALHNQQGKIQFLLCGDFVLVSVSIGSQVVPMVKAICDLANWHTVMLKPLLKCDVGMGLENLRPKSVLTQSLLCKFNKW